MVRAWASLGAIALWLWNVSGRGRPLFFAAKLRAEHQPPTLDEHPYSLQGGRPLDGEASGACPSSAVSQATQPSFFSFREDPVLSPCNRPEDKGWGVPRVSERQL